VQDFGSVGKSNLMTLIYLRSEQNESPFHVRKVITTFTLGFENDYKHKLLDPAIRVRYHFGMTDCQLYHMRYCGHTHNTRLTKRHKMMVLNIMFKPHNTYIYILFFCSLSVSVQNRNLEEMQMERRGISDSLPTQAHLIVVSVVRKLVQINVVGVFGQ